MHRQHYQVPRINRLSRMAQIGRDFARFWGLSTAAGQLLLGVAAGLAIAAAMQHVTTLICGA